MIGRGPLWLPLAVLLLLAALSFWLSHSVQMPATGAPSTRSDPAGIMENFDALRTDAEGHPRYRLSATRLRHYSNSKLTELESPHFVELDAAAGDVTAVAREATVSPDGNEVDLRGAVNVVRAAHAGQSAMTLQTERLLVFPNRDLLRAPGPVAIRDATLDMHAGAMEYKAKQRVITLTGRVQARYFSKKG
jgi:lipopolysaccharide export system protein LptC